MRPEELWRQAIDKADSMPIGGDWAKKEPTPEQEQVAGAGQKAWPSSDVVMAMLDDNCLPE